eukprot:CAMPEP_0201526376 /NCGR_PEP_ID=MMETSP0161_2-20130828/31669_1 /ASSEMBLY_ACC=CAM_ASM_000251 /TAXON_ID=180227 /ORGANISM="Neoparamoeba aestuarina, Strain SoJaBio B1-5/56/2" /LENGTH=111 /DNA_ID=CAMNT_0047926743 /DNA_START=134 /DNA_END=466 /DNA_ORIENTATION=+
MGYRDLQHWLENENHVYVGRDMTKHIPGAKGSIYGNPFTQKDGTLQERIEKYENHLTSSPHLMSSLPELKGKVLGCWCHPNSCHAHIIAKHVDLLPEVSGEKEKEKEEKEE